MLEHIQAFIDCQSTHKFNNVQNEIGGLSLFELLFFTILHKTIL